MCIHVPYDDESCGAYEKEGSGKGCASMARSGKGSEGAIWTDEAGSSECDKAKTESGMEQVVQ